MKLKHLIILFVFIAFSQISAASDIKDIFGNRKEIYFSFRIKSPDDIHNLTRIISIDNFRNDTVWAYANPEEFLRFTRFGYNVTILPPPGDAPGVQMRDHFDPDVPITTWNFYPTYDAYVSLMNQFQTNYPSICKLVTIGTLTSGRQLLAVKISDNVEKATGPKDVVEQYIRDFGVGQRISETPIV